MAYGNIEEQCEGCFSAKVKFDVVEYAETVDLSITINGGRHISLSSEASDWPDEESAARAIVGFCKLLGVRIDRIEGAFGDMLNPEDVTA